MTQIKHLFCKAQIRLCLAACFLFAPGCGNTTQPTPATKPQAQSPAVTKVADEAPSESRSQTVTDGLNRVVELPGVPSRIVSLAPKNTEILFAIGAGEQVVGVTTHCNYPPEAQEREKVGGFSAKSLSLEKIVGLKPDLVLSSGDIHRQIVEQLENLKIPVVALGAESLAGLYVEIELLGKITGHDTAAQDLVKSMQDRVSRVKERAARIPAEQRVKVYYQVWDNPLSAAGPGSYIGEMIELCGAINIVSDPSARYAKISEEVVLAKDPEVILAPSMQPGQVTREQFTSKPGWGDVSAVRNDRIYLLDGDTISRCGPRLVDALEAMSRFLYPEPAP